MEHHNVSKPAFEIPKHKVSEAIVHPEYHEEGERAHNVLVDGQPVGFVERKYEHPRRTARGKYTRGRWVWTANGADSLGTENIYSIGGGSGRYSPSVHKGGVGSRKEAISLIFSDLEHGDDPISWEDRVKRDEGY
jgi:hypothetical protein